jgi:replicative superfamily II helicase
MSKRIIIAGVMRAGKEVPISEIKQMIGRAGRNQSEEVAYADVVLEEDSIDYIREKIQDDENLLVDSKINVLDELSFHTVADIENGFIRTKDDLKKWFERSFFNFQGNEINCEELLGYLIEIKAIKTRGEKLDNTNIGRIAAKFYFSPNVINTWKKNFDIVFDLGYEIDDIAIVWALADVPVQKNWYDAREGLDQISDFKSRVDSMGFEFEHSNNVSAFPYWTLIGGPRVRSASPVVSDLKRNYGRTHKALMNISRYCSKWDMEDFFEELDVRVKYGIKSSLVDLCKLDGVGKNLASWLYNMDIRDLDDIRERSDEIIFMDYDLKKIIENLIR